MATVRNDRSGETITDDLTHAQAAELFAKGFQDQDRHWLWFWIHRYVRDVPRDGVTTPQIANERAQVRTAQSFLADLFLLATGRGLKRPMIRCHYKDRRYKLYLSAKGTLCLKSGGLTAPSESGSRDPVGDEEYVGCIVYGKFLVSRIRNFGRWNDGQRDGVEYERPILPQEQEFLDNLLGPECVQFLARCSKDMDRCCYCNSPLDDVRSKSLGYGPTCAGNWGLPWGHTKDIQNAPSFSSLYSPEAAAFCSAIRENIKDANPWAVFNDWLTEKGLPPLKIVEQDKETGLWKLTHQPGRTARTD